VELVDVGKAGGISCWMTGALFGYYLKPKTKGTP